MTEVAVTLISAAKGAIEQLYERYKGESQGDVNYISALKSVILGVSQVAESSVSQQQIQQNLLNYARHQYVEWTLENSEDGENRQQVYEESLHWLDYIYEYENYPE